jgi:hypothetical protein
LGTVVMTMRPEVPGLRSGPAKPPWRAACA